MIRRMWNHFQDMTRRLLEEDGSPHQLAGGIAVGLFFGFTPLFGVKTLLCLGVTMAMGWNPFAAVVALCFWDLFAPIHPMMLMFQYEIGYWILARPHHLPPHLDVDALHHPVELLHWTTYLHAGLPLLVGALVTALPVALLGYLFFRNWILWRRRRRANAGAGQ
jgi:uncharacterized protein (DUF2062 family)